MPISVAADLSSPSSSSPRLAEARCRAAIKKKEISAQGTKSELTSIFCAGHTAVARGACFDLPAMCILRPNGRKPYQFRLLSKTKTENLEGRIPFEARLPIFAHTTQWGCRMTGASRNAKITWRWGYSEISVQVGFRAALEG